MTDLGIFIAVMAAFLLALAIPTAIAEWIVDEKRRDARRRNGR